METRWILQKHLCKYRHKINNDFLVLTKMIYRSILAAASTFFNGSDWTRDVEQAFVKPEKHNRDVLTVPPSKPKIGPDEYLKIELPHYGLVESSSCFIKTYYSVSQRKLLMLSAPFDPCFLLWTQSSGPIQIAGLVTADSINTGTSDYQLFESEAAKSSITKKTDKFSLRFLGCIVNRNNGCASFGHVDHTWRLLLVPTNTVSRKLFRAVRSRLLFCSNLKTGRTLQRISAM